MKVFGALALTVLLMGATARLGAAPIGGGGTAYLDDSQGDLFVGDPTTGDFSLVGTSATAAGFGGFTDIGFAGNVLYGLDHNGNVYTINQSTGQIISLIGNSEIATPASVVGLSDSTNPNTLVAGGNGQVYNINTSTGFGTAIGTGSPNYGTAGDDTFANGTLYLTSFVPNSDSLFSIDQTTGAGTNLGQLCADGPACTEPWSDVFGMIYDTVNSTMYGFDVNGDEFDVNLADPTSSGTEFALSGITGTQESELLGAAFTTSPEPSTFPLIGSGLILLAVGLRRKANRTV